MAKSATIALVADNTSTLVPKMERHKYHPKVGFAVEPFMQDSGKVGNTIPGRLLYRVPLWEDQGVTLSGYMYYPTFSARSDVRRY
jgi:hypothetical protein